jgi:hypothetical protein
VWRPALGPPSPCSPPCLYKRGAEPSPTDSPPLSFTSGCEPHLSSSFASCPLQATGEPPLPPSPPRLSERRLLSLLDQLSSPLTFLVASPCCRTSPEPLMITGVPSPSSNTADFISPPSLVPRRLGKSSTTPLCRVVFGKCPRSGRQDLVAQDTTHCAVGLVGQASSADPVGRIRSSTVWWCFFIFVYNSRKPCKVLKYVENIILLRKL